MNYFKTYKHYLFINKLLDLITYLIIFTIYITFSFLIYYTTKSFFILFIIMTVIYIIGLFIGKLFEIKILFPSLLYICISISIISIICYYEDSNINLDLIEYLLISSIFIFVVLLMIILNKYETPMPVYYKLKDYFKAVSFSKKIKNKKIKNPSTENPYTVNLSFERKKLLCKLNEEYIVLSNEIENDYVKESRNLKNTVEKLEDLDEQLVNIEQRLKRKNSGAQEYELCTQRKKLKEEIDIQKNITVALDIEINNLKNQKIELKNVYDKNSYYISNAYNMRYINYVNTIKERLSSTKNKLTIIAFDSIEKKLEENNEKFVM